MKDHLQFYLFLLSIPLIVLLTISFSGGAPSGGVTGSPGDGVDCTGCHVGADTYNAYGLTLEIQTNIPSGGYEFSTTYHITVTQTATGATDHGFQITAENVAAAKVGVFSLSETVNTQVDFTGHFVTHTHAGDTQLSWSFNWTAPGFDVGVITFYVAANAANGDGSTNGDQIVFNTKLIGGVLGINKAQLLNFSMYPNPSDGQLTLQLPSDANQAKVNVYDYLGKTLMQKSINPDNNTIDVSNLSTGVYFVII